MTDSLDDRIIKALRPHGYAEVQSSHGWIAACDCGWVSDFPGEDIDGEYAFRAHLAAVLVPIVEAEKAEAWDGCCKGFAWAMAEDPTLAPVSWLAYVHDRNPYRANSYDPTGGTECTCPPDEFLSPSNCALHGDDAPNQFRHSNGEELGIPENLQADPTGGTDE
jgi:hypothetical protein